jgi:cell shape-determining protein MreC
LPDTEELLSQIEQQKVRIEQLENENQQWQELTQKLNNENSLLLTLNSR